MDGPNTAQKMTSRTRLNPSSPRGSLRSRRPSMRKNPGPTGISVTATAASEGRTDTGIQPGDDQGGEGHGERQQPPRRHPRPLHNAHLAEVGGIDDQLADAGPGKNVL